MPRQGKQLNIWIPDDVMASLEQWVSENQTTKTDAVIQAIQVLTGTHPEAPPEFRSQVQALTAVVEQLRQRLDQLEFQTVGDLQHRLDQVEGELSDLHPQAVSAFREIGTTIEEATREQLHQVCQRLRLSPSSRTSVEQLRQLIRDWQPR